MIKKISTKTAIETVYNRLTSFLNKNNLITNSQHGFREGYSTETATTEISQYIADKLDKGEYVVGVFFDLSKAFDTLDPSFLSKKLEKLGIRGNVNEWIISFITHRRLVVNIENTYSEEFEVELGTPQGSVLGPLLFLLYINDLPNHIQDAKVLMYADDTTIIIADKCKDALNTAVNKVMEQFLNWCVSNHLIINVNKTVCVEFSGKYKYPNTEWIFKLSNTVLEISLDTKFLGTYLDYRTSWSNHINKVCAKLNKSYFSIATLKNTLTEDALLNVYYANVHSVIAYNIISWGQATEIDRVFIIQKRIIRLLFNLTYMESCRPSFKSKKILTFTGIYLLKLLCYIHEHKNQFVSNNHIHTYLTRNSNHIHINRFNHSYIKKSPIYTGCTYYNLLSTDYKNLTNLKFKNKIKKLLIENCFYNLKEFETFLNNS